MVCWLFVLFGGCGCVLVRGYSFNSVVLKMVVLLICLFRICLLVWCLIMVGLARCFCGFGCILFKISLAFVSCVVCG